MTRLQRNITLRFFAIFLMLIPSLYGYGTVKASLLTCYPGTEVFELEGHTAIRLQSENFDVAVNWGVFDFYAPAFVWRFALGETDYMVQAAPYKAFIDCYTSEGRIVEEQPLNLTDRQSERLYGLIIENLRPENCTYRYNYVLDNCSTRPLAIIEKATGSNFVEIGGGDDTSTTFREEMKKYHSQSPWYQFGIDLALGTGIDRTITRREKSFAPIDLNEYVKMLAIQNPDGTTTPLVGDSSFVNEKEIKANNIEKSQEPSFPLSPFTVGCILFALLLIISIFDIKKHRYSRLTDTLFFGTEGLAGCIILFLIVVSTHFATSPNFVVLWLSPLCFIGAVGIWFNKATNILRFYHIVNISFILILLIIFLTGIQGFNIAFFPLMGCSLLRSGSNLVVIRWKRGNS